MRKKLIFSILAFCIGLLILETLAWVVEYRIDHRRAGKIPGPGWQNEFFKSFLDWHECDPDLLWRFRADLNNPLITTDSEHLLGKTRPGPKDENSFRILLLGDSSPVGLGLKSRNHAFGELLQQFLELEYHGNRKFELVNAAVSGYTSEQIRRLLELRGWSYQPDLILLYCGNNDASISGAYYDRELLERQKLKICRRLLSKSALYRVMVNLLTTGEKNKTPDARKYKVRVTPEQFGENLADIVDQCQTNDCPLIILKPPAPKLWPAGLQFRVLHHIRNEHNELIFPDKLRRVLGRPLKYCLSPERFRQLYGEGDIFTGNVYASAFRDSMTADSAIDFYTKQHAAQPRDPIPANNLGVSYWEQGDYARADTLLKIARELYIQKHAKTAIPIIDAAGSPFLYNIGINLLSTSPADSLLPDTASDACIYLDSALQADFLSLRIKRTYQNIIDSFGAVNGVHIIDLPHIFYTNDAEKLFFDHCHPTIEGHRLIAENIAAAVMENSLVK